MWGERTNYQFVERTLSGLGSPFLGWWVQTQLSSQRPHLGLEPRGADRIPATALWGFSLSPYTRLNFFTPGHSGVIAHARSLGWTYLPEEDVFERSSPTRIEGFQQLPGRLVKCSLGVMPEPLMVLPDLKDPRIFMPHFGTGQMYCSVDDQNWEGRDDAACALKYLKAYNRLIGIPSAKNLYRATENPRPDTGPAFRVFSYTLDAGVSPQFLSLMFTAFNLHYIAQRVSAVAPRDCYPVFRALLKKYLADHPARE